MGRVGSGKTSLLSALLGEIPRLAGSVRRRPALAYAAQQPWVLNATLRENVLFGQAYDATAYDAVIDACALRPDLSVLRAGDQTEIGKGLWRGYTRSCAVCSRICRSLPASPCR